MLPPRYALKLFVDKEVEVTKATRAVAEYVPGTSVNVAVNDTGCGVTYVLGGTVPSVSAKPDENCVGAYAASLLNSTAGASALTNEM